ncbi:hypothetical protein A2118_03820 [Candidatus Kaiserbacteria bacterium GWA2_50_9]|uniref:DUF5667 domain-containing protein n=1 Tax=Candidatus Kaiserbacteria bacterium GWA2_50_9 TaxID=1798474 RepID=A0A1F6BTK2_9BACT|nr:MAG: hypothetical protein A2118_03820 [Candidatus Kaiserbacteria bacterium GWA2_50_9]
MGAIGVAASLLLSAGVALAEEGAAVNTTSSVGITAENPASATTKTEIEKAARERVRVEAAARKAEIEKTAREAKERLKTAADARKAIATTTRANIKEIKQSAGERVKAVREEAKERVKAEREKATERMKDIQDKKRQQLAQRLTTRFEELNKTWTDKFAAQLDRYNAMVQKMEARAAAAAANGKDVTAATAAIQIAKNVTTATQASVAAQASKIYTPDTSTIITTAATSTSQGQEELTKGLKAAFQTLHATLFKDLFALRDGPMMVARRAVQDALQTLGKVPGVDEGGTTATSATSNQ